MLLRWWWLMLLGGWIMGLLLLAIFPRFLLRPLPSSLYKIGNSRKRILLLVAHPDDESMKCSRANFMEQNSGIVDSVFLVRFFGPTLLSLAMQQSFELRVLCISNGNAEGLGYLRKLEMLSSCSVLKVPVNNVRILDHPALQDGHNQLWDRGLLVEIIRQTVESQEIDVVISFDSYGVSGHPNHVALSHAIRTYLGARKLKTSQSGVEVPPIEGWELVSVNILRKYSGVLEICMSSIGWFLANSKREVHCYVTPNPLMGVAAMKEHKSQWVWFRKLFVAFASYTYVNSLRKIDF